MRADGFNCKNSDPMYTLVAQFMDKRYDAMNYITLDFPIDPIHNYINKKRKENINISHMAVILAAYVRTLAKFPELNRFIVNKKFYHRKDICVAMVVLKSGIKGAETESKLYFEPDDNIFEVNDKIEEFITTNRQEGDTNSLDKLMKALVSLSGLLSLVVKIIKLLDRYGLLPKAILDISPFHASMLITNLASIRTNQIYHHLYEFGTTSLSMALGNQREVVRKNKKTGEIEVIKCLPVGLAMDERIATGSYFASAFRYMKKFIENPELLEEKPSEIVIDTDVKNYQQKMKKYKAKLEKKKNK